MRPKWTFDPRRAFHGTMLAGVVPIARGPRPLQAPTPNPEVEAAAEAKRLRKNERRLVHHQQMKKGKAISAWWLKYLNDDPGEEDEWEKLILS